MRYMNEWDLAEAKRRFSRSRTPNRAFLTDVVSALAYWADHNSDGWAYWPKPCRAAEKAIVLIESGTWEENERQEETDATTAEMQAALRPIKSFLTRQGVSYEGLL